MSERLLNHILSIAKHENRRLVAPLLGLPGIKLASSNLKLAQQNYREHFKVLNKIYDVFQPDIIFQLMDLSVEANALGKLTIFPKFDSATIIQDDIMLDSISAIEQVDITADSRALGYIETMRVMSKNFPSKILRCAYVTGPYTLAALLIGAEEAAVSVHQKPDELHKLCSLATNKILDYSRLLISAGAQIICILEPSGVMLSPKEFLEFSVEYTNSISSQCQKLGAASVYHVCGNSMHLIDQMADSQVDALSLDSFEAGVSLPRVANLLKKEKVLIGNISPTNVMLNGSPEEVKIKVTELLKEMNSYPYFILSTGCDLPLETPLENIYAFMNAGKKYRLAKINIERSQ